MGRSANLTERIMRVDLFDDRFISPRTSFDPELLA